VARSPAASRATTPVASSSTHRIVDSIVEAIVERRLMPGTKLAEAQIGQLFDVSRTVVRQALNQLSRDRLVLPARPDRLRPQATAFAKWPGGARIAVQFVLNYEEGGENAVLHGDAGFRAVPVRNVQPGGLPGPAHEHGRHLRIRLARGRVAHPARVREARAAADRVRRGMALQRHPELTAAFRGTGPRDRLPRLALDPLPERRRGHRARAHARAWRSSSALTGERPLGWYTGRDSPNTRRLVADDGGFEYDSDYYGDDLPFWMKVRPTARWCPPGGALHAGHQRHALRAAAGLFHADPFFQYLRDSFDALYAEGDPQTPAPKMMSIGMHCRLLGRPGRIVRCSASLDHIATHDRVWVCRRIDIARHWKQPPTPSTKR
jgi:peptidoglycan/xylan/chitin deacetylase (PgdA/CDA1 family)